MLISETTSLKKAIYKFPTIQFSSNIEILERFQSKVLRIIGAHLGMCRIRLSEGISKYQQLKKKSASTALNIVLPATHIQMTY
jgi:hypothetical protein